MGILNATIQGSATVEQGVFTFNLTVTGPVSFTPVFTPADLYAQIWFEGHLGYSGIDGGHVGAWLGQYGTTISASSASRYLVKRENAINGLAVLESGSFSGLTLSAPVVLSGDFSAFVLARDDFHTDLDHILLSNANSTQWLWDIRNNALSFNDGLIHPAAPLGQAGQYQLLEIRRRNGVLEQLWDGVVFASTMTTQTFTLTELISSTYPPSARLALIGLVPRYLSDAEFANTRKYVSDRWNTPSPYTSCLVDYGDGTDTLLKTYPAGVFAPNGDVLLFYDEGRPTGLGTNKILLKRSTDGGKTFGAAVVLVVGGLVNFAPTTIGQTIYLPYMAYGSGDPAGKLLVSTDNGQTWQGPYAFGAPAGYGAFFPYGQMLRMPDGMLLQPGYADLASDLTKTDALLMQSTDGGHNWSLRSVIAAHDATYPVISEGSLVNTGGSNLRGAVRAPSVAGLLQVDSADWGLTWTKTPILGSATPLEAPAVVQLANGKLVLYAKAPTPLGNDGVYVFVYDGTWSVGKQVWWNTGSQVDSSYPAILLHVPSQSVWAWTNDSRGRVEAIPACVEG